MEFMELQISLQKESDSAEYYEMLLSQSENQSILIHDIKKHLQSIHTLNDQKENDKVHAYIEQLLSSSDLMEVSKLCDHEMLNTILSRYKRQCLSEHITLHTDIRSGSIHFLSDTDLTSLFCNLLDNAYEAACNIPDAFIEITAGKKEKTPFTIITVVNSCRVNPFDHANGRLTTTKSDSAKHGFGVKSIQKIVDKYHGNLEMYFDEETMTFHSVIMLKE